MNSTKTCSVCGISKPLNEFHKNINTKDGKRSECKECHRVYSKNYNQNHKEEMAKYHKEWYKKHKNEIRKQQGYLSMYENKLCASYLGVVIGERLCRHLFKDVQVMPYGNIGYDIVCNKGKKIDVKSGCITLQYNKYPYWHFRIDRNTIADFFILVAFDNRKDLNPLHLWMIPGKEINNNSVKSIRPSTMHKWDKWKRDIKDVQLCCTEIKEENKHMK